MRRGGCCSCGVCTRAEVRHPDVRRDRVRRSRGHLRSAFFLAGRFQKTGDIAPVPCIIRGTDEMSWPLWAQVSAMTVGRCVGLPIVPTGKDRQMGFRREAEMAEPAERWLISQGLHVKREFSLPWGTCDLVGCSLNKHKIRKRLSLRQAGPLGPPERILVLTGIPDEKDETSISLEELQRSLAGVLDAPRIAREVERLVRDRFAKRTDRGTLQRSNGWMPLHKRLVAVELKLSRVSEALNQASCHLGCVGEVYVGLPYDLARRVARGVSRRSFAERGVGILGVTPDGCRVLLRSKCQDPSPDAVLQAHCTERFWRSRLRGS